MKSISRKFREMDLFGWYAASKIPNFQFRVQDSVRSLMMIIVCTLCKRQQLNRFRIRELSFVSLQWVENEGKSERKIMCCTFF